MKSPTPKQKNGSPASSQLAAMPPRLHWVEYMKATAIIWIFVNHLAERLLGYPFIGNPSAQWPPFAERLAQLQPLSGYGILDLPLNLLRYVGWFGDQGVQIFILLSGFGLTWGLLNRQAGLTLRLLPFYAARAMRVYPMWWLIHLAILPFAFFIGNFSPVDFVLSFAGIRLTESTIYYLAPAWWYVGLLLQLYLVYPLLWALLCRLGATRLLIIGGIAALVIRGIGLVTLDSYLDAWSRGAIFITRLPEFLIGISLAAWLHQYPLRTERYLRSWAAFSMAIIGYAMGLVLSLYLVGMTVAPLLLAVAVFIFLYVIFHGNQSLAPTTRVTQLLNWLGQHSFSLFLVHHFPILLFIRQGTAPNSIQALAGIVGAIVASATGALILEATLRLVSDSWRKWKERVGLRTMLVRLTAGGAALLFIVVGTETLIAHVDPQEVCGWGELPSLEMHPTLGWHLRASTTTHLRWESYDYTVTANSLGFPGPEFPAEASSDALRIMTVGDAFTSAEGVDTAMAWPRLLETALNAVDSAPVTEVLNFAITGYGPNQYATVISEFAPRYRPDLIIIGFFVNDYEDVLVTNEMFWAGIGFEQSTLDHLSCMAALPHTRKLVSLQIYQPLSEMILHRPRAHGYFLGHFHSLERAQAEVDKGVRRTTERLAQIAEVADEIDADVILLMIPAPVQICSPAELRYYPQTIDLSDTNLYDLDLPQQRTQQLAEQFGFSYYDLRPILRSNATDVCVYQPNNLHWTAEGHRRAADYLAESLINDGFR